MYSTSGRMRRAGRRFRMDLDDARVQITYAAATRARAPSGVYVMVARPERAEARIQTLQGYSPLLRDDPPGSHDPPPTSMGSRSRLFHYGNAPKGDILRAPSLGHP